MQNKGFVKFFAIMLALICVYYLSFSFATRYQMNKAEKLATDANNGTAQQFADKLSLIVTLPHRSGSLAALLSRFAARGLNLTKLESSPIPGRDFEFMFCIDLDAPVPEELPGLLNDIGDQVESLTVLGLYHEQK